MNKSTSLSRPRHGRVLGRFVPWRKRKADHRQSGAQFSRSLEPLLSHRRLHSCRMLVLPISDAVPVNNAVSEESRKHRDEIMMSGKPEYASSSAVLSRSVIWLFGLVR